jgi:hypothetical protein
MKRDASKPGPLESYPIFPHCEMCGARDYKKQGSVVAGHVGLAGLEPAFNPSGEPMTLCRDCRIGSAELLADVRADLLAACKLALKVTPALGYEPGTAQRNAHDALVAAIAEATKR